MKIEVSFTGVEAAVLQQILADESQALQAWDVESLPELVHLLAMHGADHAGELMPAVESPRGDLGGMLDRAEATARRESSGPSRVTQVAR